MVVVLKAFVERYVSLVLGHPYFLAPSEEFVVSDEIPPCAKLGVDIQLNAQAE
jgi:hypothetical protein